MGHQSTSVEAIRRQRKRCCHASLRDASPTRLCRLKTCPHDLRIVLSLCVFGACVFSFILVRPDTFSGCLSLPSGIASLLSMMFVHSISRLWIVLFHSVLGLGMSALTTAARVVPTTPESSLAAASTASAVSGESAAVLGAADYSKWTVSAIAALQTWYNEDEGVWLSTGWWNAANCLTVLGDFYAVDVKGAQSLKLEDIFTNTFSQAQGTAKRVRKTLVTRHDGLHLVESRYERIPAVNTNDPLVERGFSGFINDYYDDEGWWALAWIRAYDVTGHAPYLTVAESIFHDMQGGLVNATCGGGIWWNKDRTYKNAIANELYLSVAASLANRASNASAYLAVAEGQWAWFQGSGMINKHNLVNDGLIINANGTCVNNGGETWSYNQGVILGGLVELYKATGNSTLLSQAVATAEAAITALSTNGILHDSCEDDCGTDGSQFKGSPHTPHRATHSSIRRLISNSRRLHAKPALLAIGCGQRPFPTVYLGQRQLYLGSRS